MINNEKVIKTENVDNFRIKEIFENGYYRIVNYYDKEHTKISYIQYYNLNGEEHRENDLPSFTSYYKNGNSICQIWEQNDKHHRFTGPAWIEYDTNGKVKSEQYWINNNKLTKEEWQKEVNLYNNLKLFRHGVNIVSTNRS